MSSPQHCLAMAAEADRLADIVSYERDKARLHNQAAAWRQMAATLAIPPGAGPALISAALPETRRRGVAGWLGLRRA